MPQSCCANGCTNRRNKDQNIQFFKFPFKRPEVLNKWVNALGRVDFVPTKSSTLCSNHFEQSSYAHRPNIIRPYLKDDAVPSIFEAKQSHLKKRQLKKNTTKRRATVKKDNINVLSSKAQSRRRNNKKIVSRTFDKNMSKSMDETSCGEDSSAQFPTKTPEAAPSLQNNSHSDANDTPINSENGNMDPKPQFVFVDIQKLKQETVPPIKNKTEARSRLRRKSVSLNGKLRRLRSFATQTEHSILSAMDWNQNKLRRQIDPHFQNVGVQIDFNNESKSNPFEKVLSQDSMGEIIDYIRKQMLSFELKTLQSSFKLKECSLRFQNEIANEDITSELFVRPNRLYSTDETLLEFAAISLDLHRLKKKPGATSNFISVLQGKRETIIPKSRMQRTNKQCADSPLNPKIIDVVSGLDVNDHTTKENYISVPVIPVRSSLQKKSSCPEISETACKIRRMMPGLLDGKKELTVHKKTEIEGISFIGPKKLNSSLNDINGVKYCSEAGKESSTLSLENSSSSILKKKMEITEQEEDTAMVSSELVESSSVSKDEQVLRCLHCKQQCADGVDFIKHFKSSACRKKESKNKIETCENVQNIQTSELRCGKCEIHYEKDSEHDCRKIKDNLQDSSVSEETLTKTENLPNNLEMDNESMELTERGSKSPKKISQTQNLKEHLTKWYSRRWQFQCNQCEMKFRTKGRLQSHLKKSHQQKKQSNVQVSCRMCQNVFDTEEYEKVHRKSCKPKNILETCTREAKKKKREDFYSMNVEGEKKPTAIRSQSVEENGLNSEIDNSIETQLSLMFEEDLTDSEYEMEEVLSDSKIGSATSCLIENTINDSSKTTNQQMNSREESQINISNLGIQCLLDIEGGSNDITIEEVSDEFFTS